VDVAPAGIVDPLGPADLRRVDQVDALIHQPFDLHLGLVAELVAVGPEQLDAIVRRTGLWLAEIITPRSARSSLVSIATAGVGIGPSSTTSMPTDVKPATIADSIM
jgi:hypothetical protein